MRPRHLCATVLLSLATACSESLGPAEIAAPEVAGTTRRPEQPGSGRPANAQGAYLVGFHRGVADPDGITDELIRAHGGQVEVRYRYALNGFAGRLPEQAIEAIRLNPNVQFVEADGVATVTGPQANPPSWGLDRIDALALPLDNAYSYENDGRGVRVYIIDTGIWFEHPEYAGRAGSGWDFVDNDPDASDCHGHGTHVAGTVGGSGVGVAKGVTLVAIRVLGCTGSAPWSRVISGIEWLIANHIKPAAANLSLGGGYSNAVNTAVENAVAAGITVAVSAGNSDRDACSQSPASALAALTVAASTQSDARAPFSNYGACVDLFAPGMDITSSVKTGGYESWDGTSMASPHVAGVAALVLAANPVATPAAVAATILDGASADRITDAMPGTPNRLVYSGVAGPGVLDPLPPPPPPPPPSPSSRVRVADLDGSATADRGSWSAAVRVLVQDLTGAPVAGARVYGEWTDGAAGSGECTTGADGWCQVGTGGIKKKFSSVRYGVYRIQAVGMVYEGDQNADPDGDSDGTTIVVIRP